MISQARLQVHLLVAMLIAGVARPIHASVPLPSVGVVEAVAAHGPRIAVISVGLDAKVRPQLGLLEHAAESAISRAARFDLITVVDAYDPSAKEARRTAGAKADVSIREGVKALDDLDHAKAVAAFVDALAQLRQTNVAANFGDFINAWVLKAASHSTGGENAQARQDIERIVAVSARAEFPNQHFAPELLEYAETQRRIASNAKGELTVRTEPSGAAVWVDGQYRGASPTLVKNIMGGRHVVTATLGGYTLGQEEMTPGEGLVTLKPAALQPALTRAQELISKHPNALTREQAAMALGKKVGANQVLLIIGKKSLAGEQIDLTAIRIDVTDGHNWGYQTAVVPMNDEATASSVLDLVVASDTARLGNKPVFHVKGGNAGITGKQTAGIVLLGAGLALAGAGVASGLQAQSAAGRYLAIPQVQTTIADGVATRGRTFSIVADVSFILAAGSLAVGSIFIATGGAPGAASNEITVEPEPEPAPAKGGASWGSNKPAARPGSDWSKPATAAPAPEPKPAEPESAAEVERRSKEAREAEAKRKETQAREAREEERRKKDEAERQKREAKKSGSKKNDEERRLKEEEERKVKEAERAEEERRKKAEEAKKAEAKRLEEEAAKKKKKEEDHDDLRNY